jgi:hemolysin III
MIFVLVAGTYTPFAVLVLAPALGWTLLGIVWGGALAGIALSLLWVDAPRWLSAAVYVALGWVAIIGLPQLWDRAGAMAVALLATGGVLYTVGAIVYARRRPDPSPRVFGYHEVFHVLVIAAATVHFAAIAVYAV